MYERITKREKSGSCSDDMKMKLRLESDKVLSCHDPSSFGSTNQASSFSHSAFYENTWQLVSSLVLASSLRSNLCGRTIFVR